MSEFQRVIDADNLWCVILKEAQSMVDEHKVLSEFYKKNIIQHDSLEKALAYIIASKLSDSVEYVEEWQSNILKIMQECPNIAKSAKEDLLCQLIGNASIKDHHTPLLYFNGYLALQCYRIAHYYWTKNNYTMASYIQGKVTSLFSVDIHPAAIIGKGVFMDHAFGIVVGETAVIEDGVTIFHGVTLGGKGKLQGDRHPKVRKNAFIGSGATILGNIEVGEGAKIASGAVVIKPVSAGDTMIGSISKSISTINKS
ncbi:UNVERIFIED_CONTAM: hypothetical protein GTU68_036050 [Idotea baltica]|nr:hypothetical protein [Idotea baltica]